MKIDDFKDVPEWANFIAMDADGKWFAFQNKPVIDFDQWFAEYGDVSLIKPKRDWTTTLTEI